LNLSQTKRESREKSKQVRKKNQFEIWPPRPRKKKAQKRKGNQRRRNQRGENSK